MEVLTGQNMSGRNIPTFEKIQFLGNYTESECDITCDKHGIVKGMALYQNDVLINRTCPLCIEECEKEEEERIQRAREEDQREKYRKSNIEPEYIGKSLDDYKPLNEAQKKFLDATKRIMAEKTGKVIALGPNGVGKSFMGNMAVKELGGAIYTMYEIATMIKQSYKSNSDESELDIVNRLASIPMLVIDEAGRSKGSKFEMDWMSYIIDKRHTRKLPLMILSNKHFRAKCKVKGCENCFENFFDNDVLSRLRQNGTVIDIPEDTPDWRNPKNHKN